MTQSTHRNIRIVAACCSLLLLAPILGDVTGDGSVGVDDLLAIVTLLGSTQGDDEYVLAADVNQDGVIDLFDLIIAARNFGQTSDAFTVELLAPLLSTSLHASTNNHVYIVRTNSPATCRLANQDLPYAQMSAQFYTWPGGLYHGRDSSPIGAGQLRTTYIRCLSSGAEGGVVASYSVAAESPAVSFPNEPPEFVQIANTDWSSLANGWAINYRNTEYGSVYLVEDHAEPISPGSALAIFYEEGFPDGFGPAAVFHALGVSEVFIGMSLRFDDDFAWHAMGVKMNLLALGPGGWHTLGGGGFGGPTGVPPDISLGSRGLSWDPEVLPFNIQTPEYGPYDWIIAEWHVRLNTPGQADGVARMWINGELVTENTQAVFPADTIVQFEHSGTWGGGGSAVTQDQAWYVGHTYMSVPS